MQSVRLLAFDGLFFGEIRISNNIYLSIYVFMYSKDIKLTRTFACYQNNPTEGNPTLNPTQHTLKVPVCDH